MAATKSVVEQALFYRSMLCRLRGERRARWSEPAARPPSKARQVLEAELGPGHGRAGSRPAPMIYFAGRNNGVAEELTLKTNEITHKKSDYLEGTYAVHGIEEVMHPRRGGDRHRPVPGGDGEVQGSRSSTAWA